MKKISILIISFALLGACRPDNLKNQTANQPLPVRVMEVKKATVTKTFNYSGTIVAGLSIPLNFQTSGTVARVMVDVGDPVKKGQLLATLETNDYQNIYDISQAKYKQAQDAYNRLKLIHDQGSLPDIKWVEMETNLEQARSSMELSKYNLNKCYLHAPASGFVGQRNLEPGMSSMSLTTPPLELVDIRNVYVKVAVPENEIGSLKKGMLARFSVSALHDNHFEGKLSILSLVADVISRTYEAKIIVSNPKFELKPGMVCDVTLELPGTENLTLIPYSCVSTDNEGRTFVFLVEKNLKKVRKQFIQTGSYTNNQLLVVSGLSQGEIIVSEGKEKLFDNSLITY